MPEIPAGLYANQILISLFFKIYILDLYFHLSTSLSFIFVMD